MKFADLLYVSIQNFRNRKSRFFFTILGVAVAIAVVLSLVSFGYGLQQSLLGQITNQESLLSLNILPSDSKVISLNDKTLDTIRKMKDVEKVSPEATFNGKVSYSGIISEVAINSIESDFFVLDGNLPVAGRFFTEQDTNKIVVSAAVASLMGLTDAEIIGKKINATAYVNGNTDGVIDSSNAKEISLNPDYEIIGVVEGTAGHGEIYVQSKDFKNVSVTEYQFAKVKAKNQDAIEGIRNSLIDMGFLVSALSDIVNQANKIFSIVQVVLGVFGVFALVVAAIGLVNTMTISLLERTNEIGIMRAIGGSPTDIRKIFLGESILIGFMGGICGILLGLIVSESLNWLFNILAKTLGGEPTRLFSYPIWFILFIIILSTFVGLVGGIWPAHRAANMNPLKALRYK